MNYPQLLARMQATKQLLDPVVVQMQQICEAEAAVDAPKPVRPDYAEGAYLLLLESLGELVAAMARCNVADQERLPQPAG